MSDSVRYSRLGKHAGMMGAPDPTEGLLEVEGTLTLTPVKGKYESETNTQAIMNAKRRGGLTRLGGWSERKRDIRVLQKAMEGRKRPLLVASHEELQCGDVLAARTNGREFKSLIGRWAQQEELALCNVGIIEFTRCRV